MFHYETNCRAMLKHIFQASKSVKISVCLYSDKNIQICFQIDSFENQLHSLNFRPFFAELGYEYNWIIGRRISTTSR